MLGVEFCGVSPEAQPDANAAEVLLLTRKLLEGEGPAHCTRLAESMMGRASQAIQAL